MSQEKLDSILDDLKTYEYKPPALPIGDFHSSNAYAIFRDELINAMNTDKVEAKHLRGIGKTVGLALLYGGTEYTVSQKLGITTDEATPIIQNFYSGLPILRRFHEHQEKYADKNGHIYNIFGGKRYLPFIKIDKSKMTDPNERRKQYSIRSKAFRLAKNAPIQMASAVQLWFILITLNKFIEENKTNRMYGNLRHTYKPYTRIVSLHKSDMTPELEADLDLLEDGHVKVIVKDDDGSNLYEYDRNVAMTSKFIESYGLTIEW